MKKILTLCLLHKEPEILLGMKKYGFGEGKWNGFGGRVEEGEDIEDAARRELVEEAGIEAPVMEKMGILEFEFHGDSEVSEVHIFKATDHEGEIVETDEMRPEWFHTDHIPYEDMWQDHILWLPLLLEDKKFVGKVYFDKDQNILNHSILEIDEFE